MSRRRHQSSSPFSSLGSFGNILNNLDMGTLSSILAQFAPMNASQGGSPLGNLGNLGNIASLMAQFTAPQGPINQNTYNRGSRRNSNKGNDASNNVSNNRSNNFGDFDIETFGNMLSQMGFGNVGNLNNNYGYSSSTDDSSVDEYVDLSSREDHEGGEDVIDMLRMLKRFLTEDRAKVIDAMITLYEENSK